jgi:hypothetical protein
MPLKVFSPVVAGFAAYPDKHMGRPNGIVSRLTGVGKISRSKPILQSGIIPIASGPFVFGRPLSVQ